MPGDAPGAEVVVDAHGRFLAGGTDLDYDQLRAWILAQAEESGRDEKIPGRPSVLHLVVRADRRAPWAAAACVVAAAEDPAVRVFRIHLGGNSRTDGGRVLRRGEGLGRGGEGPAA